MITPVKLVPGAAQIMNYSAKMVQGGRQSNFGNVERIPPSAGQDYDFGQRAGSLERFDFTFKAPSSQRLDFDFTQ